MNFKLLIALLVIFIQFSSGCKKEDDPNSFKIEIRGTVIEKGTNTPIPEVEITLTGPSGEHITTTSSNDGTFSQQFFGSKTATLTLKKEGYVFEHKQRETDSIQNFRSFDMGTYFDLILEMKKITTE